MLTAVSDTLVFFDKPYYLVSASNKPKLFNLLREILWRTHKAGIVKITIRAREHIAAIYPYENILALQLLRYSQGFVKASEFNFPNIDIYANQFAARELELTNKIIENMSHSWQPESYHNESREHLLAMIKGNTKEQGSVKLLNKKDSQPLEESKQDIIMLLEKSLGYKQ